MALPGRQQGNRPLSPTRTRLGLFWAPSRPLRALAGTYPRGSQPPRRSSLALLACDPRPGRRDWRSCPRRAPLQAVIPVPALQPPASPRPGLLRSTWLDRAILGSQEAPSQGKAEPRPAGGGGGGGGEPGRRRAGTGRRKGRATRRGGGRRARVRPGPSRSLRLPLPLHPGEGVPKPLPSSPRLPLPRR